MIPATATQPTALINGTITTRVADFELGIPVKFYDVMAIVEEDFACGCGHVFHWLGKDFDGMYVVAHLGERDEDGETDDWEEHRCVACDKTVCFPTALTQVGVRGHSSAKFLAVDFRMAELCGKAVAVEFHADRFKSFDGEWLVQSCGPDGSVLIQ